MPLLRVTFPGRESGSSEPGGTGERRGATRAPPRAPLGGRTKRRGSQRPGRGANGGQPSGARPGPRKAATRVGPGAEQPGRLRPWRRGWHGRSRGWELHNLAAAPAGPASSPGDPERGKAAGCPRDPCPRRPPLQGPPRPPPPPRAAHPGRARAARRPLRQPGTEPGPRSPLTEAAAAPGRRSASLPAPRANGAPGRARPPAVRADRLGPTGPPPAPRSPSPPEFGALLQCLRG